MQKTSLSGTAPLTLCYHAMLPNTAGRVSSAIKFSQFSSNMEGWLYTTLLNRKVASLHYIYVFVILPLFGRLAAILAKQLSPTFRELPKIIASSDWEMNIEKQLIKNGFTEVKSEMLSANGARLFTARK